MCSWEILNTQIVSLPVPQMVSPVDVVSVFVQSANKLPAA